MQRDTIRPGAFDYRHRGRASFSENGKEKGGSGFGGHPHCIAMFKNGIRIVSLTLLGAYVDPRILQSDLHREGGIPFFIVALLLLVTVLYFLRKSEGKGAKTGLPSGGNDKNNQILHHGG